MCCNSDWRPKWPWTSSHTPHPNHLTEEGLKKDQVKSRSFYQSHVVVCGLSCSRTKSFPSSRDVRLLYTSDLSQHWLHQVLVSRVSPAEGVRAQWQIPQLTIIKGLCCISEWQLIKNYYITDAPLTETVNLKASKMYQHSHWNTWHHWAQQSKSEEQTS